jgi:predicted acylesterase/phospholipase RssA
MRCAAQAGALTVLIAAGVQPSCLAGCGAGALVAAIAANGEFSKEMLQTFKGVACCHALIRDAKINSCLQNHFGNRVLREIRPLAMPTIDLETGIVQVFSSILPERPDPRPWSRQALVSGAVRAAMAAPGVLKPVRWRGRILAGGGQLRNTLPGLLDAMGADITVCIRVLDAGCARYETHPAALALCAHAVAGSPVYNYNILIPIEGFDKTQGVLEKQDIRTLFQLGQVAAISAVPRIKSLTGQAGAKILQFPGMIQG